MVTWYILCKDPPFWLCDNLEEWDGVGDGKEAQEEGDMYTYNWAMLVHGRNQHNIVIILQLKINS